jgi:hypothetical protein
MLTRLGYLVVFAGIVLMIMSLAWIRSQTRVKPEIKPDIMMNTEKAVVLPSLLDIQKRLNILEPTNLIAEDGVYGLQTKDKWERVWMNEQAKKYIEEVIK